MAKRKVATFNLKTADSDAIARRLLEVNKPEGTDELPSVDYGHVYYPDDRDSLLDVELEFDDFPNQCGASIIGCFPEGDLSEGQQLELALILKNAMSDSSRLQVATLNQEQTGAAKILAALGWEVIKKFTNPNTGNEISVFCYQS